MRVVVAPHNFEVGGSQIVALELAAEIAGRPENSVILYAPDGPLAQRAEQLGLEIHETRVRDRQSLTRMRELSCLARASGAELVHTYEWVPSIDAALSVAGALGLPLVSSIMSMEYPHFFPKSVPLVLGTDGLYEDALARGWSAHLIEPPVDTEVFHPDADDPAAREAQRWECGARNSNDCLVVVIGRLSSQLKLDGLLTLISAVGRLAAQSPVRLAVIGDGPERETAREAAEQVNRANGTEIVRMLGERIDPLPYYLAADVVVGMGASAIRAMAVGKPLLVQGTTGFWAVADEDSLPMFTSQGWFGVGDGSNPVDRCIRELGKLVRSTPAQRRAYGEFGRSLVEARYSLRVAGDTLEDIYRSAITAPRAAFPERLARSVDLSAALAKYQLSMRFPWLQRGMQRLMRG